MIPFAGLRHVSPGENRKTFELRLKSIIGHRYIDYILLVSVALCFGVLLVVSAKGI
ncbi:MAG TPA: hypothetical protein VN455_12185 [Methanotrichaceae archaeon]|nr:hypothetical protein [Methanotrichaceae archaeon]